VRSGDDSNSALVSRARCGLGRIGSKRGSLRLAAVLLLALIAGLVTWLATGRGHGKLSRPTTGAAQTVVVSEHGLQELATALGEPIYWVGPRAGARYELEQRSSGQVYVRYLATGTKPGTIAALTVGTYPIKNAYETTVALGKRSGWMRLATGVGGVAAFGSSARPCSVYLALPGLDRQVEVYDPRPGRAAALVRSGRALPVTDGERLGLMLSGLRQRSSHGEAIYWMGRKPGVTYEYRRDPNGNVFLRYLPKGVAVGSRDPFPTVGTYPMTNAFATTRAAAHRPGAVPVAMTGAVAFYTKSEPKSVYLAFRSGAWQIEVYDPVPGRALAAVVSGKVKPVG
jgi:hypothetical protein